MTVISKGHNGEALITRNKKTREVILDILMSNVSKPIYILLEVSLIGLPITYELKQNEKAIDMKQYCSKIM